MKEEDIDKEISKKYCPRFGMIAVDKGFVTPDQLKEALAKQIEDDLSARPHRVIGRIFFEDGRMTHRQIEEVLNVLFKEARAKKEEC